MAEETDITQVQMALEDLTNAMTATIGIAFTDTTDKTESDVDAIDATGQALQNAINIINKLPDYRLHISNDISGPDEKARYTAAMQTLERKQQEAQHVLQTAQRQLDDAMTAFTKDA